MNEIIILWNRMCWKFEDYKVSKKLLINIWDGSLLKNLTMIFKIIAKIVLL